MVAGYMVAVTMSENRYYNVIKRGEAMEIQP